MKRRPYKNQPGFVLIMFLLVLMGAGGLLLIEFSEGVLAAVESKKFEHNKRVLEEAKQALLQSAYNYPITNDLGPGRLPCADTDNDGTANCGSTFGRLPWNQPNLNLYDIRDADGERLWYAVSSAFRPQTAIINSDSSGNITLRDQSGHVIFDGANPGDLTQYGIAAVIIAPGVAINRNGVNQDRSIANTDDPFDTTADDDPGIITATNYLDLVLGTEDNAGFTNGSATDGFILGPIEGVTNDQFIVITAAEVVEMAEKAAMQAYQTAINDYRVNTSYCDGEVPDGATTEAGCLAATTPGTWTIGPYPWLYNYAGVSDVAGLSSYYPADAVWATELAANLTTVGRIPAKRGEYFTETDSQSIESALSGSIGITIPRDIDCGSCSGAFTYNDGEFRFNDFATLKTPVFLEDQILTDVRFVDIAEVAGEAGRLTGNSATAISATLKMYFWDDDGYPTEIYTPCGDDGDGIPEVSDCNRDSSGNPKPGGANLLKSIILYIEVSLDFPYSAGAVNIDMDYTADPVITTVPATANSHAIISATFADTSIINGTMPTISGGIFKIDEHYHAGETYLFQEEGPHDTGTIDSSGFVVAGPLTLGIRYYPELPDWVFTNDWHDSVILAYAEGYKPGGSGSCTPDSGVAATACIEIQDYPGGDAANKDKVAILINAGEHDWDNDADSDFSNDLWDLFDNRNGDLDYQFTWRWRGDPDNATPRKVPPGNDNLIVLEES